MGSGNVSSIFSTANIGVPAAIVPIIGIFIISFLPEEFSMISIVLGLVESLFISPDFSKFSKCLWTVDVDLNPTAAHISLTEGGYPLSAT
jgi:hypothetical protein